MSLWPNFHRAGGYEAPHIPSTHCCRETSVLGLLLLENLGQTGWRLEFGQVNFDADDNVPIDITDVDRDGIPDKDITSAPHVWLVNDVLEISMDLTADQFGSIFIPTGEGPLVARTRDLFYTHEVASIEQDWSNDPQIVEMAEEWLEEIAQDKDFIETLKDCLGGSHLEPKEVDIIPPKRIREAVKIAIDQGISQCQPTSPEEAFETIQLLNKSERVFNLHPREGARDEAIKVLDLMRSHIEEKWKPGTAETKICKQDLVQYIRDEIALAGSKPECPSTPRGA
jgi:hypothetical protein